MVLPVQDPGVKRAFSSDGFFSEVQLIFICFWWHSWCTRYCPKKERRNFCCWTASCWSSLKWGRAKGRRGKKRQPSWENLVSWVDPPGFQEGKACSRIQGKKHRSKKWPQKGTEMLMWEPRAHDNLWIICQQAENPGNLLKSLVGSPSLEILKTRLPVALGDVI